MRRTWLRCRVRLRFVCGSLEVRKCGRLSECVGLSNVCDERRREQEFGRRRWRYLSLLGASVLNGEDVLQ